jgi:hypothetical protein
MKRLRKTSMMFLAISLMLGSLYSVGWTEDQSIDYRTNLTDLLIVRPLGIVAAAAGTGVFIVTLPFTLPTRSADDSFNMFVVEPWKFAFVREFPDETY